MQLAIVFISHRISVVRVRRTLLKIYLGYVFLFVLCVLSTKYFDRLAAFVQVCVVDTHGGLGYWGGTVFSSSQTSWPGHFSFHTGDSKYCCACIQLLRVCHCVEIPDAWCYHTPYIFESIAYICVSDFASGILGYLFLSVLCELWAKSLTHCGGILLASEVWICQHFHGCLSLLQNAQAGIRMSWWLSLPSMPCPVSNTMVIMWVKILLKGLLHNGNYQRNFPLK